MGERDAVMERDLLVRLTERWGQRVAVKKDELDLDGHFDEALPDFPEHLVPVTGLHGYGRADPAARERVLAASWVAYNSKTTAVEEEIILPACRLMLDGSLPGRRDDVARTALHQTVIDEHYHVLMCMNAVGVTRRRRGLDGLGFDPTTWAVVRGLEEGRRGLSTSDANLVTLAFSLAAETTINAFLLTVSQDATIQPMNRLTVELHRQDESGHASIFRELVGAVYRELEAGDRRFFVDALVAGLTAFRAPDHEPWVEVAGVGGIDVDADELAATMATLPKLPRDTGPLRRLADDLGIREELKL